jgi:Helicase conserved C-terminal domain
MSFAPPGVTLDTIAAEVTNALALLDRESFERLVLARRNSGLAGMEPLRNIDGRTVAFVAAQISTPEHVTAALRELSHREMTMLRLLWRSGPSIPAESIAAAFARLLDERALRECLGRLRELALVLPLDREKSALFVPACVRVALLKRTGPARPAAMIFGALRADDVQRIYSHMAIGQSAVKKVDRIEAIVAELSQADHVKQRIDALPELARRIFDRVVQKRGAAEPYALLQNFPEIQQQNKSYGFYLNDIYTRTKPGDGLLLLENQGLVVRFPPDWASKLLICDEVLTALLPPVQVTAADFAEPSLEEPPAAARPAGGNPSPVLDVVECMQFVDEFRPALTQKGLFAKPDAKRLSRRLSRSEPGYADFIFALALKAGLLRHNGSMISVVGSSQWLGGPELEQISDLYEAWQDIYEWRDDRDEGYVRTGYHGATQIQRSATVRLLAELPAAGASLASLARRLSFRIPNLFVTAAKAEAEESLPVVDRWMPGVVRSLAWLGLVEPLASPGSAAPTAVRLTPAGRALIAGREDPAAAGVPRVDRLIVQPTLDVLAPPNIEPAVYRTLRGFSEPVSATGMRNLTLTMNSLRRAVDAGQPPDGVRTFLQTHSDAPLPNTVDILLTDVQEKYGRIHVGYADCYITVDDPHLLAELGADKRLAGMIGRVIAPTVALVHAQGLERVLEKLRAAGHMPVFDADTAGAMPQLADPFLHSPLPFPAAGARGALRQIDVPQDVINMLLATQDEIDRIVPFVARTPSVNPDMPLTPTEPISARLAITELLRDAVSRGARVEMEYRGKSKGRDQRLVRKVDIYAVEGESAFGYCLLRNADREFKLDRIVWARLTGEPTEAPF